MKMMYQFPMGKAACKDYAFSISYESEVVKFFQAQLTDTYESPASASSYRKGSE